MHQKSEIKRFLYVKRQALTETKQHDNKYLKIYAGPQTIYVHMYN